MVIVGRGRVGEDSICRAKRPRAAEIGGNPHRQKTLKAVKDGGDSNPELGGLDKQWKKRGDRRTCGSTRRHWPEEGSSLNGETGSSGPVPDWGNRKRQSPPGEQKYEK